MKTLDTPRTIHASDTFGALVNWIHDELVVEREAPGFIVGLSGTDSLVAFCATAYALEREGKGHRLMGVHFAPSDDFLYDHPGAQEHLWFRDEILPWLRQRFPNTKIIVDTSIDWRCDGLRWGALMEMSVVSNGKRRVLLQPEEQYWIMGTRNLSEDMLAHYSNASTMASVQPLIHLWKSEILQISEHLEIPQIAIAKSCETDCICGRDRLAANHMREVDLLLMSYRGELSEKYVDDNVPHDLQVQLLKYINLEMLKNSFKRNIPYIPGQSTIKLSDPLVAAFEDGSLNLREFNHRKHLYVAWYYLKNLSFGESVRRYAACLYKLLSAGGYTKKFDQSVTEQYFFLLDAAVKRHPTDSFDELVVNEPDLLISKRSKTSA